MTVVVFRFQIQQLIQRIDRMNLALLFRSALAFRRILFLLHGTGRRGWLGREFVRRSFSDKKPRISDAW